MSDIGEHVDDNESETTATESVDCPLETLDDESYSSEEICQANSTEDKRSVVSRVHKAHNSTRSQKENFDNQDTTEIQKLKKRVFQKKEELVKLTKWDWRVPAGERNRPGGQWRLMLFCKNYFVVHPRKKGEDLRDVILEDSLSDCYEKLGNLIDVEMDLAKRRIQLKRSARDRNSSLEWKIMFRKEGAEFVVSLVGYGILTLSNAAEFRCSSSAHTSRAEALKDLETQFNQRCERSGTGKERRK